mgnify:FL=1
MNIEQLKQNLTDGSYDSALSKLYGTDPDVLNQQRARYLQAAKTFSRLYPERSEVSVFSAPGRTEIGGNHTDHQHGCVLAASVNLDVIAIVAFHQDGVIRLQSAGYPQDYVELQDLSVHSEEKGTSAALIRGIVSRFREMGVTTGGFDAYTTSNVLGGSGLSSSAAFEVLIGTIIDQHDNAGKAGAVEIAKIGQYAENSYFGKKSGLMDQMVSSVGSFVFIDFEDTDHPKIEKLSCQFEDAGYVLCITDTKGSHADLTDDYVSIPAEMNLVAAQFGKNHLREVSEQDFLAALPTLRTSCSDRAIIRAAHFYGDNRRASEEAAALSENDFARFLELVKESGDSSAKWLQNLYSCRKPSEQGITLGLWMSEQILGGKGASRVHGGGFAGTIQAFVPKEMEEQYCAKMDALFGSGSCQKLRIRTVGGVQVIA